MTDAQLQITDVYDKWKSRCDNNIKETSCVVLAVPHKHERQVSSSCCVVAAAVVVVGVVLAVRH